jgi:leader peptidase (prepilin peptidase)/N-methyltransferase
LGLVRLVFHLDGWLEYVIGFFAVSLPLLLILLISGGRGIGGGDVKLMAVCGLFLG